MSLVNQINKLNGLFCNRYVLSSIHTSSTSISRARRHRYCATRPGVLVVISALQAKYHFPRRQTRARFSLHFGAERTAFISPDASRACYLKAIFLDAGIASATGSLHLRFCPVAFNMRHALSSYLCDDLAYSRRAFKSSPCYTIFGRCPSHCR